MLFTNLPNQIPTPNKNNLTGEAEKYWNLYININRTVDGAETFTSASSGTTYSTNAYPNDPDVYNKGQQGMMNLLYKYILKTYIVTADVVNEVQSKVENVTLGVTVNYIAQSNTYNIPISAEPNQSIYTIRFKTPNDYVANAKFQINNVTYTPVLSGSAEAMPAKTFVKDRVLTANVDKTSKIITFTSSKNPDLTFFVKQSATPTSEADKAKLWVNTSDNTLNYWTGSQWKKIVGVWG